MSIITKVTAQKRKGRYNIFLDNQYAFSVSENTLTQYRLFKDVELTDQQVSQIKQAENKAKAVELATSYLSYQPRTIKEIKDYLKKHEVEAEVADQAVSTLSELGYIDDASFARLFVKNNLHVGKDGPNSVKRKLLQKGVDDNIITDILDETNEDEWNDVGLRLIHSLIHQQGKIAVREIERKAKTKLMSHGFGSDQTSEIIALLDLKNDEQDQLEALKKQGIKVYKRYRNQDEFTRKQKVKRYLYQHGFASNEIDMFLNGEIIDLSELNEY